MHHPFSQRLLNCAAQIVNYQAYCPLLDHHAVLLFWCLGLVGSTDLEKCLILLLEQVVPTDYRLYELKLLPSESPVQLVKLLRYLESQLFQTVASVWGLSFGFSNERYHLHEFISAFTFGRDRCFLRLKFMTWIWLSCLSIHFVLATSCWWWKAGGGSSYSLLQPLLRSRGEASLDISPKSSVKPWNSSEDCCWCCSPDLERELCLSRKVSPFNLLLD